MFKPGERVYAPDIDLRGAIVREIEEDDDYFQVLLKGYNSNYGVSFFETVPKPEPPFYIVQWDYAHDEELAHAGELEAESKKSKTEKNQPITEREVSKKIFS